MRPRGGLTLIEMLAVVALLGLAAGLGAIGLSAATDRARLDQALHDMRLAHVTARSLAMAGHSVALTAPGTSRISLTEQPHGEPVWNRGLPGGLCVIIVGPEGVPRGVLEFDAVGRCADHDQVLMRGDRIVSALRVSGVTGWTTPIMEGDTR